MKLMVYIETTIPSYYCDHRSEMKADIARTREWWDAERDLYECFVSPVVIDELAEGNYTNRSACLALVKGFPLLAMDPEVIEIARIYQEKKLMPKTPVRDALHLALASFYRMDYLLTWNCIHLANANKARHLEKINFRLGLSIPRLVTPHMLQIFEEDL